MRSYTKYVGLEVSYWVALWPWDVCGVVTILPIQSPPPPPHRLPAPPSPPRMWRWRQWAAPTTAWGWGEGWEGGPGLLSWTSASPRPPSPASRRARARTAPATPVRSSFSAEQSADTITSLPWIFRIIKHFLSCPPHLHSPVSLWYVSDPPQYLS